MNYLVEFCAKLLKKLYGLFTMGAGVYTCKGCGKTHTIPNLYCNDCREITEVFKEALNDFWENNK